MSKEDGGPAFPRQSTFPGMEGMSIRDYFAAQALNAVMSKATFPPGGLPTGITEESVIAAVCYDFADAMLAERSKP